jgi:hypothetical protein
MLDRIRACRSVVSQPLFTRYCINTRVNLSCLEDFVLDTAIDDDWLRTSLDPKFFNYIEKREALKAVFYIAAKSRDRETIEECMLLYNSVLYFYLFYKYFPKCDSYTLDAAYRLLRKDALLSRFNSHYRVVKYAVESQLARPLSTEDFCNDLYKRFVRVKNTLNQSLRSLAIAYYRVRKSEHSIL